MEALKTKFEEDEEIRVRKRLDTMKQLLGLEINKKGKRMIFSFYNLDESDPEKRFDFSFDFSKKVPNGKLLYIFFF